jgi:hypothetical protein
MTLTAPTTTLTTRPREIGETAAAAIAEVTGKSVGAANVSTYLEGESPLRWESFAEAGWDLVGIVEEAGDPDAATLRDLVAIALAWGRTPLQLPLLPTILAKRHCAAAAEHEGPVSFAVPTPTSVSGWGVLPFGQVAGLAVVTDVAAGEISPAPEGEAVGFDPVLRSTVVPLVSTLTPDAARELAVVWAAEAAGAARRALDDAVAFVKQREQFGRPVGSFQAVKHHLANAHIATEQAETAAVRGSLEEFSAHRSARHGVQQALRAVELSLQVQGGLGFTWEMGVHFHLRHLAALRDLVAGLASPAQEGTSA